MRDIHTGLLFCTSRWDSGKSKQSHSCRLLDGLCGSGCDIATPDTGGLMYQNKRESCAGSLSVFLLSCFVLWFQAAIWLNQIWFVHSRIIGHAHVRDSPVIRGYWKNASP